MKVCLINSLFTPDNKGGVETVVQNVVDELIRQKHKVVVICAGKEKNKTLEEKMGNIKIYRIGWNKYFSFQNIDQQNTLKRFLYRLHQLNNKYSAKIVQAILNKEKPDLILSHNTLGLGYNIIKEINKTKIKHINTIHDVQLLIPSGKLMINQKITKSEKIYSWWTKNIYKQSKNIISPSRALIEFYTSRGFFPNAETKIIPNPILVSNFSKQIKKEGKTKKLKILYLGQLEKHKGIMNLIKAFKKLDPEKFWLTIAGRGSLSTYFQNTEHILSNFKFWGEYNSEQRIKLLKEHDILVVPSLCFENAPMVILEAWQAGVPVLASNFGGIPELIEEEKTGWLFNPENIENLQNKIEKIYKNRAKLDQMSKHCHEKIKNFDLKIYLDKIFKI